MLIVNKILKKLRSIYRAESSLKHSKFIGGMIGAVFAVQSGIVFAQTPLVSSLCSTNQEQEPLYFGSPPPLGTVIYKRLSVPMNGNAIMAPYWDVRYTKPISRLDKPLATTPVTTYANHLPYSGINSSSYAVAPAWGTEASKSDASGSLVQTKCINGYLAASAAVNGWDSVPVITFGGPAATWTYQFTAGLAGINTAAAPWHPDGTGNLMLQGLFTRPYHHSADNLGGAEVNLNVFLADKYFPSKTINFVISVFRSNGILSEGSAIAPDPTTGAAWVSTLIQDQTQWVTASPYSYRTMSMTGTTSSSEMWPYFYRVNITYANLMAVLRSAKTLGVKPENWVVTNVAVQTEITGSLNQSVGSSVRAFEVYSSNSAL